MDAVTNEMIDLEEKEALITGVSVPAPLLITVDHRLTHHGGTTPGLIRD